MVDADIYLRSCSSECYSSDACDSSCDIEDSDDFVSEETDRDSD